MPEDVGEDRDRDLGRNMGTVDVSRDRYCTLPAARSRRAALCRYYAYNPARCLPASWLARC